MTTYRDNQREHPESARSVALSTLRPCDTVFVQTRSSHYRVFLLDPESGRSLLQGGNYFQEPTEVTVKGASFGGPVVKPGSIDTGLRLEISTGGRRLITSPVEAFRIERIVDSNVG